jgi:hypothetical protein
VRNALEGLAKFAMAFFVMTIACTILWETMVDGHLYNCTDPGFLDYLTPGDWVHRWEGHPLKTVARVVPDGDMEHPDTIREGWTIQRLWGLWYLTFGGSVIFSATLATVPWSPLRKIGSGANQQD